MGRPTAAGLALDEHEIVLLDEAGRLDGGDLALVQGRVGGRCGESQQPRDALDDLVVDDGQRLTA